MILDQQVDLRMRRLRRKLAIAVADAVDGYMIGWAGRAAVDADGLRADCARDIEPLLESLNVGAAGGFVGICDVAHVYRDTADAHAVLLKRGPQLVQILRVLAREEG